MRILHTADLHIRQQDITDGQITNCLGFIIDWLVENGPVDLALIAGDIFDRGSPSHVEIAEAQRFIYQVAQNSGRVVVVQGNHEIPRDPRHISPLALLAGPNVVISLVPQPIIFSDNGLPVCVFPVPSFRRSAATALERFKDMTIEEQNGAISQEMVKIIRSYKAMKGPGVNILTGHFMVGGAQYGDGQIAPVNEVMVPRDELEGFHLVALGHIHKPQPFYCGSIERTRYDEEKEDKGFKVVTLKSGKEDLIEFIPTPATEYITLSVDEFLRSPLRSGPKRKVRVKGTIEEPRYLEIREHIQNILHDNNIRNDITITTNPTSASGVSVDSSLETTMQTYLEQKQLSDLYPDLMQIVQEIEDKS